jgi:hypothetical protein
VVTCSTMVLPALDEGLMAKEEIWEDGNIRIGGGNKLLR